MRNIDRRYPFKGRRREVDSYKALLLGLCEMLHETHGRDFDRMLTFGGSKRSYFWKGKTEGFSPRLIPGTDIYVETNFSATDIVELCCRAIVFFGHSPDDFQVETDLPPTLTRHETSGGAGKLSAYSKKKAWPYAQFST